MSNNILISIVIPVYNLEAYIAPALESLFLNDLSGVEVIVIDDGSTDTTFSIASSLLECRDVCCQIVKQDNAGVSSARNHGINLAKGEYIFFLDGDDIVKNDCFKNIKQVLECHKYDLISFGYDIIDEGGNCLEKFEQMYRYPEPDISINDFIYGLVKKHYGVRIGTVALKKSIIDKNMLSFNVDSRYGEDVEFLYKYIISSSNFYYIKSSHLDYLQRDTSAMASRRVQVFDSVYSFDRVYEYFVAKDGDDGISRVIKSILIPRAVVRCVMRGVRDGELQVSLGGHLPDGMKERLQGVRYMAFEHGISMLLAIFMLIHFPGLFALIMKK